MKSAKIGMRDNKKDEASIHVSSQVVPVMTVIDEEIMMPNIVKRVNFMKLSAAPSDSREAEVVEPNIEVEANVEIYPAEVSNE